VGSELYIHLGASEGGLGDGDKEWCFLYIHSLKDKSWLGGLTPTAVVEIEFWPNGPAPRPYGVFPSTRKLLRTEAKKGGCYVRNLIRWNYLRIRNQAWGLRNQKRGNCVALSREREGFVGHKKEE
jgi:hypothetical protein